MASLAASYDSAFVVGTGAGGHAFLYRRSQGSDGALEYTMVHEYTTDSGSFTAAAFTPDNQALFLASCTRIDSTSSFYGITKYHTQAPYNLETSLFITQGPFTSLTVSHDGKALLACGKQSLTLWDFVQNQPSGLFTCENWLNIVSGEMKGDGSEAMAVCSDGNIYVVCTRTRRMLQVLDNDGMDVLHATYLNPSSDGMGMGRGGDMGGMIAAAREDRVVVWVKQSQTDDSDPNQSAMQYVESQTLSIHKCAVKRVQLLYSTQEMGRTGFQQQAPTPMLYLLSLDHGGTVTVSRFNPQTSQFEPLRAVLRDCEQVLVSKCSAAYGLDVLLAASVVESHNPRAPSIAQVPNSPAYGYGHGPRPDDRDEDDHGAQSGVPRVIRLYQNWLEC
eukprot:TRINITY_DN8549_c0_g1::TRINITY_DN8549_c0_g1_i1::g.8567::m.8567 TRINITY_DN8549_c0_g1::TRINITY_DN8549_c0_g1_i1::g.8567  ORF type:complete len:417 (-),score=72.59,NHL/PF01436.16/0.35 TRINITY_DN8549_c0_g1_i1:542-1708(-)